MRRVAMQALSTGLTLTAAGGFVATGFVATGSVAARPVAAVRPAARVTAARPARLLGSVSAKTVRFGGYQITVPANWPVYYLDRDPAQCVRYDRHAVYLGRPGADQLCPAHLVGRADTVSVQAAAAPAPPGPGGAWRNAPEAPAKPGGPHPAAGAAVLQNTADHQLAAAGHPGLAISATYAGNASLVSAIIRSARQASGTPTAPARPPGRAAGGTHTETLRDGPAQLVAASPRGHRPGHRHGHRWERWRGHRRGHRHGHRPGHRHGRRPGRWRRTWTRSWARERRGFDTCAAPSLPTMRTWRRHFSAIAIYIGGPEAACGWGNLSRGWVRATTRMGWALIPTYVGRQAPCSGFQARIRPRHAYAEGRAAARHAIALAAALGIGRHAPIYDDMEAYRRYAGCREPVLSFLDGWTRQLRARGHISGVYSSAGAAVLDLRRSATVYGRRLAKPGSVWFGLWDGRRDLRGMPYLPMSWEPRGHRIKQWRGSHWRRIGGVRLNIDSDIVSGAVYR